jgi:hypothetical protein
LQGFGKRVARSIRSKCSRPGLWALSRLQIWI